jgi:hypothetical protein
MEFHGKLYGKIAGTFFDTGKTTDDYDKLVELLKEAATLVGNPCTNISSSTDIACDNWQNKYNAEIMKQTIK